MGPVGRYRWNRMGWVGGWLEIPSTLSKRTTTTNYWLDSQILD